jgi:biotin-(acetyl-CoA carboxylase) ligase
MAHPLADPVADELALHLGDTRQIRRLSDIAHVMSESGTPAVRRHAGWLLALYALSDGDPAAGIAGGPSLHKRVESVMVTLGRQVRAQLPGDHEIIGHASRLDEYGSLLVVDKDAREHVVTAGDVVHLRPWTPPGEGTESGYA